MKIWIIICIHDLLLQFYTKIFHLLKGKWNWYIKIRDDTQRNMYDIPRYIYYIYIIIISILYLYYNYKDFKGEDK